jgi:NAD(P)H-hydrate epimerase
MSEDSALFDLDSVRRLECAARAAPGGGESLMERAGRAAWRVLLDRWPSARGIVVVCGRGGNGGDGYVLARQAHAAGRDVRVVAIDAEPPRDAEPRVAHDAFVAAGGRVDAFSEALPAADVIVDALVGIGLQGALDGRARAVVDAMRRHGAPVLALDVPSGVGANAGDCVVNAHTTVEFLLPKLGLHTGPALEAVGDAVLARLDVPAALVETLVPAARRLQPAMLGGWLAPRGRDSHKGRHGRVLCVGGDAGSGGAIMLCAEAALRAGAGLVRVHTRPAHGAPLLARVPEAMVSTEAADFAWADGVALGPGLGRSGWGEGLLEDALACARPVVADADALNILAAAGRRVHPDWILTPHPGEAARLLGSTIAAVQGDRPAALAALVARFGCTVVLKGAGTLVGAPGRTPRLVDAGNAGMATGGTGDVLTGVIAALRAQGLAAFDAACCGALLHSAAGDAAAADGMRGLRASDLMPHLRRLANP